jgi:endonuclease/exonuclease/phosphatase family metal-dependent hydrolase
MKRRWKWPLGCLSVILVVFLYRVISVYEFREGSCSARTEPAKLASTYPRRLLVMTYNIQGHAALLRTDHIERIAAAINEVKPDIVAINEAHRKTWQSRFRDHVPELQRLTKMQGAFGETYDQLGGRFGNLVLTRGRIAATNVYKLPGAGEPRSLLETTIDIDGGRVMFYVTHLTAWEKLNRATRTTQLKCLTAHVRSSRYPYILAGDMNAPPDAPEIVDFLRDNTLQMAGNGAGSTHRVMNLWIDYIFADRGWQVLSARPLDIGPSDHRPMVAELTHEAR